MICLSEYERFSGFMDPNSFNTAGRPSRNSQFVSALAGFDRQNASVHSASLREECTPPQERSPSADSPAKIS
jgi:hypothetical protein